MEIVEREGSECRRMKGGETKWWGKGKGEGAERGGRGEPCLLPLRVR